MNCKIIFIFTLVFISSEALYAKSKNENCASNLVESFEGTIVTTSNISDLKLNVLKSSSMRKWLRERGAFTDVKMINPIILKLSSESVFETGSEEIYLPSKLDIGKIKDTDIPNRYWDTLEILRLRGGRTSNNVLERTTVFVKNMGYELEFLMESWGYGKGLGNLDLSKPPGLTTKIIVSLKNDIFKETADYIEFSYLHIIQTSKNKSIDLGITLAEPLEIKLTN